MPKYILNDGPDSPLKVEIGIDSRGFVDFRVDDVIISSLSPFSGKLLLSNVPKDEQPEGLDFDSKGEIVTF